MQEQPSNKPPLLIPMLLGAVAAGTISLRRIGDEISFICKNAGITKTLTGSVCIAELNEDDITFLNHVTQLQELRAEKRPAQRSLRLSPSDRRAAFQVVS